MNTSDFINNAEYLIRQCLNQTQIDPLIKAWLQIACLDLAKARQKDIRKTDYNSFDDKEIDRMKDNKCIVHGCSNHADQGRFVTLVDQGRFVGEMCSPCHTMITTGKVMPTDSFLNQITSLEADNEKLKNILRLVCVSLKLIDMKL
jgi:hypothetical protein